MAHQRVSDLPQNTAVAGDDLVYVVDSSEADIDQQSKHMTVDDLGAYLGVVPPTSANGTATIPDGSTSVTVNHGIAGGVIEEIHPTNIHLAQQWSVQNKTATSFDVVLLRSPGAGGASYWWKVTL